MSSLRIPIEVAEVVIDAVAAQEDSSRALARCVLVCKSWFPRSRHRLWHRLIISRGEQLSAIYNTLARDTSLRSMIQIVRLEDTVLDSNVDQPTIFPIAAIVVLLPHLGHITAWEFHGRLRSSDQSLFPTSPAILASNVYIYDALTSSHLRTLSPPPICTASPFLRLRSRRRRAGTLALSADERYLLSDVTAISPSTPAAHTESICVWTLDTGSCEPHFPQHRDSAPPGTDTQICATSLREHSSPAALDHRPHVVAMCDNGTLLTAAAGSPDEVAAVRPAGLPADLRSISHASFSADGTRAVVVGARRTPFCLVLDTFTGATIAVLDDRRDPTLYRDVDTIVDLSGDGRVVAIKITRSEWWLWRLEDGTMCAVPGRFDGCMCD
ncbi:uncharacterized protein BXZ73DRAFT_101268 [Epithele typhae]|uniref:uncharacterized protein n=1 Tax=Epithele typhae TaxID=378194 RepID=UPI0020079543|nr:uncharacterized protein BXZ73DRAFT_101268 [Epithele typhae]KAH9932728.1 hypothetical protein BXZ73DRAFT_101268 [Epithele typhae]